MSIPVERAVNGRGLYQATAEIAQTTLPDSEWSAAWDDLTWTQRDLWEAKADELNEARRTTCP